MVKAPRSKGCRVCVQRRVKCDQTRPYCLRCQKANRECPGFETINFVDEGPSVRELYKTDGSGSQRASRASSSSSSSSSSSHSRPENIAPFEYLTRVSSSVEGTSPIPNEGRPDFERSVLVSFMAPSVYQAQLLSALIDSISSKSRTKASFGPGFTCHSLWLAEIASRTGISTTLAWAVRTISLSHFGRTIQDQGIIEHSRRFYGKALVGLSKSLQDPEEGLSSDTLSATILLSFYELLTCTERHSWVRHAGGAGNLIRIRGPERHRYGFDRAVFLACRFNLVIEAFQIGKPCFLDLPPWRELSRQILEDSPNKTAVYIAREDVFQQIVGYPGYMQGAVTYLATGGNDPEMLEELASQGRSHRSTYKEVQARLLNALQSEGHEPTKTASSYNDKLFPVVYQFPDLLVASLYCGYWSLLSIINITLIGLEAKLSEVYNQRGELESLPTYTTTFMRISDFNSGQPTRRFATASPSTPHEGEAVQHDTDIDVPKVWSLAADLRKSPSPQSTTADTASRRSKYLAENIINSRETCKSVEFMSTTAFLGPLFLIFALRVAIRVLEGHEEKAWILKKLADISKNMGLAKTEADVYVEHQQQGLL